jgi:transcriptional regulator GlxA family with amidase domain
VNTAPAAPAADRSRRVVAVVLFKGAEELDFAGPWEVFAYLAKFRPDLCQAFTVSQSGGEVRCAKGLRVIADHAFATAPPADVLIVPGGVGRKVESHNPAMLDFVRRAASRAQVSASVCTGAFILHHAGLLQGKPATTYWAAREELRQAGHANVVDDARFVDAGAVVTAAGVSAGIDMSLHLVGRLWGAPVARWVQQCIEYFPNPPYGDVPIPQAIE